MRLNHVLPTLFVALALPLAARADTIQAFGFSATLNPGTASGMLDVDTTSGVITFGDFKFSDGTNNFSIDAAPVSAGSFGAVSFAMFLYSGGYFQITAPGATGLVGYQGGPLCSSDMMNGCFSPQTPNIVYPTGMDENGLIVDQATNAILSSTPEPSSLALLGTGMLGLLAVSRRRFLPSASQVNL